MKIYIAGHLPLLMKATDSERVVRLFFPWSSPALKMIEVVDWQSEKRLLWLLYNHTRQQQMENHCSIHIISGFSMLSQREAYLDFIAKRATCPTWHDWHQNLTQLGAVYEIYRHMEMAFLTPWKGHLILHRPAHQKFRLHVKNQTSWVNCILGNNIKPVIERDIISEGMQGFIILISVGIPFSA